MKIVEFDSAHAAVAAELAMADYEEERERVPALPVMKALPDLRPFADNHLGVAAFEGDKMLGFLCCLEPWEHAFQTAAKGTFSPMHAHGARKEGRGKVYQRMYQAAAEKWVKKGITYHSIALYAHEETALSAFLTMASVAAVWTRSVAWNRWRTVSHRTVLPSGSWTGRKRDGCGNCAGC